jgi:dinuclear metal center YbgI/SA1388 family protein
MKLSEFISAMEAIAPTRYAEPWDNVGLLVGDPGQEISKALLTIDYTADVAAEGREQSCDLVIAYHPPVFDAVKRITGSSLIYDAIRRGVAVYSPHTALDVADGGTNDMLADALGLEERQPLRLSEAKATQYKLVVFAPEDAADRVAEAVFCAGAGRIGNYTSCSFRTPGTGTFYGEAGANPAVGEARKLERVQEVRIETVLPIDRVGPCIRAMRNAHPYEEPAFDLVQLAGTPEGKGQGRIGDLPEGTTREALVERVKRELNLSQVLVAGTIAGVVRRAACCAGACGDLLKDAIAQKAQFYLTGEMRHHDALRAAECGMTVVCALHSNSERAVLRRVAERLANELPALATHVSQRDADPFLIR